MTLVGLAARNVLRNKFRAVLTVLGVAVSILTFIMLRTVVQAWTVGADFAVKDRLSGTEDSEINVNLKFRRLSDMEPEAIANQVPELKKLLDLRGALTALKGPLGNEKAFRNKIQQILGDPAQRNKLINELGLKKEGE